MILKPCKLMHVYVQLTQNNRALCDTIYETILHNVPFIYLLASTFLLMSHSNNLRNMMAGPCRILAVRIDPSAAWDYGYKYSDNRKELVKNSTKTTIDTAKMKIIET